MSSVQSIMVSLLVVGLGTGAFISPNNSALMGSAPRSRQGIASGILATARNFGMVLGIGISGAIFTTVLAAHSGSGNVTASGVASNPGLFAALQASFLAASLITILGIVTSAARVVNKS